MKYIGTQKLETNRLILRRLRKEDAFDMFDNWCNDEEVTKYFTNQCEIETIIAKHMDENINSGKVMQKCGYVHSGSEIIKDKYKNDVKLEIYKFEK